MDIKRLADEAIPAIKSVIEDLRVLKGWNMNSLKTAFDMAPAIVKKVEVIKQLRGLTNEECQELAVELITRFRPAPWWLPTAFYKEALRWAIDSAVTALKDRFDGK